MWESYIIAELFAGPQVKVRRSRLREGGLSEGSRVVERVSIARLLLSRLILSTASWGSDHYQVQP